MLRRKKNKDEDEAKSDDPSLEEFIDTFRESMHMILAMHVRNNPHQPHEAARLTERDVNWALRDTYREVFPDETPPIVEVRYRGDGVMDVRLRQNA